MTKTYIYLAERNKKSIQILCVLQSNQTHLPVKILDASKLGLPTELENKIVKYSYENRMLFELWAETSENYINLKKSLNKRGFFQLPASVSPKFTQEIKVLTKVQKQKEDLNIKSSPVKTMIRKK